MFETFFPISFVFLSVRPEKDTIAFFKILYVLTFISSPVRPIIFSLAMHLRIFPVSYILSSVWPSVCSVTIRHVVSKFSFINTSIRPFEDSFSIFQSLFVFSFIWWAVDPSFLALSILLIIDPISNINSSVFMCVNTLTLSNSVFPLPFIHVAIWEYSSISMRSTISKITFIVRPIYIKLIPFPIRNIGASLKLALITRPVIQCNELSPLSSHLRVESFSSTPIKRFTLNSWPFNLRVCWNGSSKEFIVLSIIWSFARLVSF